jgi:hypothetical protein
MEARRRMAVTLWRLVYIPTDAVVDAFGAVIGVLRIYFHKSTENDDGVGNHPATDESRDVAATRGHSTE